MLYEFTTNHAAEVASRARERISARTAPALSDVELSNGVPRGEEAMGGALKVADTPSKERVLSIAMPRVFEPGQVP